MKRRRLLTSLASVSGSARMLHVETKPATLGGIPVLRLLPRQWRDDGRVLVYVHGGGFTSMSVRAFTAGAHSGQAHPGSRRAVALRSPPA